MSRCQTNFSFFLFSRWDEWMTVIRWAVDELWRPRRRTCPNWKFNSGRSRNELPAVYKFGRLCLNSRFKKIKKKKNVFLLNKKPGFVALNGCYQFRLIQLIMTLITINHACISPFQAIIISNDVQWKSKTVSHCPFLNGCNEQWRLKVINQSNWNKNSTLTRDYHEFSFFSVENKIVLILTEVSSRLFSRVFFSSQFFGLF